LGPHSTSVGVGKNLNASQNPPNAGKLKSRKFGARSEPLFIRHLVRGNEKAEPAISITTNATEVENKSRVFA